MGLFRKRKVQEKPTSEKPQPAKPKNKVSYKVSGGTNYGNILSAEQKKEIVRERKKAAGKKEISAQATIPFRNMSKDGIMTVNAHYFCRCISFEDIGYATADKAVKEDIFNSLFDFYNFFDDTMHIQLFCDTHLADLNRMEEEISIPLRDDVHDAIRTDLSEIIRRQLRRGNNGFARTKYLVFGIEGPSINKIRNRINTLTDEIMIRLDGMEVASHALSGYEWLSVMKRLLNPGNFEPLLFNFDLTLRTGLKPKDFIVPSSMAFKGFKGSRKVFRCGDYYGTVSYLQYAAETMNDKLLKQILEVDQNVMASIHVQPFSIESGKKRVRDTLTIVQSNKVQQQQKAVRDGYDMDTISSTVAGNINNLSTALEYMEVDGDRLFNITILVCAMAKTPKQLSNILAQIGGICRNNSFQMIPLDDRQEDGFMSILPQGYLSPEVRVDRAVLTRDLAGFIPFTTVELLQLTGRQLYRGINPLSGNIIMADRTTLDNPNGLTLGPPGSGKTFDTKQEIMMAVAMTDDDIFVIDPEGEYKETVKALHGTNIVISSSSSDYINPLDIDIATFTSGNASIDGDTPEDAALVKVSYVTALMNIIVGDADGLPAFERSIVDLAAKNIFDRFLLDPKEENMPLLEDIRDELKHLAMQRRSEQKIEAAEKIDTLADALMMYTSGSANLFNHRTNVDINNRLICFDIKNLPENLKKIAMMTIQEMMWHRVHHNRAIGKYTRNYMDEFHILLSDPMTAEYTVKMFKRLRKYGGIPTGITQNIVDVIYSNQFLQGTQVGTIFANCDHIVMLKQRGEDVELLQKELHFSNEERKYINGPAAGRGKGLLFFGDKIIPFENKFPKDTKIFEILQKDSILHAAAKSSTGGIAYGKER